MNLRVESDMHRKRKSANIGVAVCLVLFIALIVALSLVKLRNAGATEAFDHAPRATSVEVSE